MDWLLRRGERLYVAFLGTASEVVVSREIPKGEGTVPSGKRLAMEDGGGDTRAFCIDEKTKELLKEGFVSL